MHTITRNRHAQSSDAFAPRYVVWELTLKCDLACRHCGSRAGKAREEELSAAEARDVVQQMAEMGTREITFIGGEAYLYPEWLEIVRAATDAGIRATMTTGARALTADRAKQAADAGMKSMSVSVDGLEATHDRLRAVKGSFKNAIAALGHIKGAGMIATANTQWNLLNLPELEELGETLLNAGIRGWQVQITGPMGRASDMPDLLLQPHHMLDLVPRLAKFSEIAAKRGCKIHAANNLGYFGPFEQIIRSATWQGCVAGKYTLGIESNGDVKGCPSLPSQPYVGGNLRHKRLREIWEQTEELAFARDRDLEELWGRCKSCYYAESCRGGCSWTAHTLLGKRGNMPYCYHRADMLAQEGLRERLVRVEEAPGTPFDFGRFELIEEPVNSK